MRYLLDTHTWLWLSRGDELTAETQQLCKDAARKRRLYLAPISVWEAGLKASRKRILVSTPIREWLRTSVRDSGVILTQFDFEVAADCAELPPEFHGDPADRILAATCRINGLILLTRDKPLLQLASQGIFQAQKI